MKITCSIHSIEQVLFVSFLRLNHEQNFKFIVHEMAHAWHAMLDYENEDLLENFSRVNETGIYEGQGFSEFRSALRRIVQV